MYSTRHFHKTGKVLTKAVRPPPELVEREVNLKRNWLSDAGSYPIMVSISFASLLVLYEWGHASRAPNVTWSKHTRGSLNYVENDLKTDPDWAHKIEGKWIGPLP